jgi:hypothetical protein
MNGSVFFTEVLLQISNKKRIKNQAYRLPTLWVGQAKPNYSASHAHLKKMNIPIGFVTFEKCPMFIEWTLPFP